MLAKSFCLCEGCAIRVAFQCTRKEKSLVRLLIPNFLPTFSWLSEIKKILDKNLIKIIKNKKKTKKTQKETNQDTRTSYKKSKIWLRVRKWLNRSGRLHYGSATSQTSLIHSSRSIQRSKIHQSARLHPSLERISKSTLCSKIVQFAK